MDNPGFDAEYDMPSRVSVNNGLTLDAIRQSITALGVTYPEASGVVSTYGKMEFTGGYLQISMKQPSGDGAWPSLWLMPGQGAGNSGDNYEVDLQEGGFTGAGNPNDAFAYSFHPAKKERSAEWWTWGPTSRLATTHSNSNWVPGKSLTWYLNGKQIWQITSATTSILNEPMELIMSMEVGNSSSQRMAHAPGRFDALLHAHADRRCAIIPKSGQRRHGRGGQSGAGSKSPHVTGRGGTVAMNITETAPSSATAVSLKITGLPTYETISDGLGDTFTGSLCDSEQSASR